MQMNQLVHQNGERLFVTSLDISNRFARQHKDVLKAIRLLDCSEDFNRRNFALVEYEDAKGEKRPKYEITRDGFVFLCMGFTGSQAALWKERYIEAFNHMERALRGNMPMMVQQQQLGLARDNGQLRDMLAAREQIIQAKDQVIMALQDKLIGVQGRTIRLVGQVANMQKRQHDREIIALIERMESEGRSRDEISAVTGRNNNYIRQRVHIARLAGRLNKQGVNYAN